MLIGFNRQPYLTRLAHGVASLGAAVLACEGNGERVDGTELFSSNFAFPTMALPN